MKKIDIDYLKKYGSIIGLDEAGRGPLAGPVVTGGVLIETKDDLKLINKIGEDSKKLSEKERHKRYENIIKNFKYKSFFGDSELIDELNIFKATQYGMTLCKNNLSESAYALVDGKNFKFSFNFECIIKGDSKSSVIGAASIVAKYERDKYMIELSETYKGYGFEKHKGYPTKKHIEAIKKYGVFSEYRLTFNPVKRMIIENEINFNRNDFSPYRLLKLGL